MLIMNIKLHDKAPYLPMLSARLTSRIELVTILRSRTIPKFYSFVDRNHIYSNFLKKLLCP